MTSTKYRMWMTIDDSKRCPDCKRLHGKIYHWNEPIIPKQPLHLFCRCCVAWLRSLLAGTATKRGQNGADWWIKNHGKLPSYYISLTEAKQRGWNAKEGNLHEVSPGTMLSRGVYENRNGHLPSAPGRIWYEADINYERGYRGLSRILFSNDGLIFITYDHCYSFIEII